MAITLPSAADVRVIIDTTLTDGQIDSIIADASLMAEVCISSLDSARQAAILKFLAAHIISQLAGNKGSKQVTQKTLGDASETYAAGTFGDGLKMTSYGYNAMALDPNGCLVNIGKIHAKLRVL